MVVNAMPPIREDEAKTRARQDGHRRMRNRDPLVKDTASNRKVADDVCEMHCLCVSEFRKIGLAFRGTCRGKSIRCHQSMATSLFRSEAAGQGFMTNENRVKVEDSYSTTDVGLTLQGNFCYIDFRTDFYSLTKRVLRSPIYNSASPYLRSSAMNPESGPQHRFPWRHNTEQIH